ncbi:MAG: glycoside hydrolase family 5 protein [Clostridia bacterium]|nr:glycoside hydrolase family 5 protein [Clostridia bacterium]
MKKRLICIALGLLMLPLAALAPAAHAAPNVPDSAWELAAELNVGWNLGNSLEAQNLSRGWVPKDSFGKPGFEAAEELLGNPVTTRALFQAVADRGFSAVRIPLSFYNHLKESQPRLDNADGSRTYRPGVTVDPDWLARVREVVDWALDAGLYVMINNHHDTSMWMNVSWIYAEADDIEAQTAQLTNIWRQVAEYFRNYDHRLIFQSTGEIVNKKRSFSAGDWRDFRSVHYMNQRFIETVRAAGGKNAERFLVLPTYAANSGELFVDESFFEPYADSAESRLLFSVHNYATDIEELEWSFARLYKCAVRYGAPFLMDECGALVTESAQVREAVSYTLAQQAEKYGAAVFIWDAGVAEHGYIDRRTTMETGSIAYVTSWTHEGVTYETDSEAALAALFRGKAEARPLTEAERAELLDDSLRAADFAYLNAGNFARRTPHGSYFRGGAYLQTDADAARPFTPYSPAPRSFACIYPYMKSQRFQAALPEGMITVIKELDGEGRYLRQKYISRSEGWYVPSEDAAYMAITFRTEDAAMTFADYEAAVRSGALELYPAGGSRYVPQKLGFRVRQRDGKLAETDVVKMLRPQGWDHAATNEPTNRGYDPTQTARTAYAMLNGAPLENTPENAAWLEDMLAGMGCELYTRRGLERLDAEAVREYLDIRTDAAGEYLGISFTSKAHGAVKITFPDGSELLIVTPGDINLDGEMNANDWANIMRWTLQAEGRYDTRPEDGEYRIAVGGREYNLWALLADMTDTDAITSDRNEWRKKVDSNDWTAIMYLTLQAWKR